MNTNRFFLLLFLSLTIPFSTGLTLAEEKPLSVKAFLKLNPKSGSFNVLGYVVKRYRCPPCPKGSLCKPCMRSNVLISSASKQLMVYPPSGDYMVVFTEDSKKLKLGKSYLMKVEVQPYKTTLYPVNDLELVEAVEQED